VTFEGSSAQPTLADGRSYLLVVERGDGSEFKMVLQAVAVTQADRLIVILR
jgi:hypothetical protein